MGLERVCVFAGTQQGNRPQYRESARLLGRELAARQIDLVYGGAGVGLMGALADGALDAGGTVIGVLPKGLQEKEGAHEGITELRLVESMHERKAVSAELADGFVALPGGLGSLDELVEIATWFQLQLHSKPIGVMNVAGYFDRLASFLDHAVAESFLRRDYRSFILFDDAPGRILDRLEAFDGADRDRFSRSVGSGG
jgi:uncharacterized protein (TIGR00730 family)